MDPRALARLTAQQIADIVLHLDQERRHYEKIGATVWAAECAAEIDRLVPVFQMA
jgi:hypothetical protein